MGLGCEILKQQFKNSNIGTTAREHVYTGTGGAGHHSYALYKHSGSEGVEERGLYGHAAACTGL